MDRSAAGVGGGPDKKAAGKTEDMEAGSIDKNAEPAGTIAGRLTGNCRGGRKMTGLGSNRPSVRGAENGPARSSVRGSAAGTDRPSVGGLQPAQTSRLSVRKAVIDDLPQIMEIFDHARKFMKQSGNPTQWGDNYPPEEVVIDDIAVKGSHVCGGRRRRHFGRRHRRDRCRIRRRPYPRSVRPYTGQGPSYDIIEDGAWLSDEEYSTIHRVAGDGRVNGVFEAALDFHWLRRLI